MREVTEEEKKQCWEEAKKEFPYDEMMQEIYYVKLLNYTLTKDLSPEELLKYVRSRTAGYKRSDKIAS